MAVQPLTLTRSEAAALCGLTPSGFDVWVRKGIVPTAIRGTRRWSRAALEVAINGTQAVSPAPDESPLKKWLREAHADVPETPLQKWHREHPIIPEPRFPLDRRQKIGLRKLGRRDPQPQPLAALGDVGEQTIKQLLEMKLVKVSGYDRKMRELYMLTKLGGEQYDLYEVTVAWNI